MKRFAEEIDEMLTAKKFITPNGPVYRFTNAENFVETENESIMMEISQDMEVDPYEFINLNDATCNFLKKPGQIYHLYIHFSGKKYFSMISPEEWGEAPHKYIGSWKFENNSTWTNATSTGR